MEPMMKKLSAAVTHQSEKSETEVSLQDMEIFPDLEQSPTLATQISTSVALLSPEHQQYLLKRHGTLDLNPLPGHGHADPYNWPSWKKISNLLLVAFHAAMSTLTAASIIPAYSVIAEDLNVSMDQATYLTSIVIAILGVAPLFWKPFSSRYGRRPIFLLSLVCSLLGNIGCAESKSYAATAGCRALVAFFISPAGAIGSAVVSESFFQHERARYMGIWSLLVTIGIPIGPLCFGAVTTHLGYRWIYRIMAITNAVQFILYLFLGPETRYLRKGVSHEGSDFRQEYLNIFVTRIDPKPLRLFEFVQPLTLMRHPYILIPACAYAMNFLFGSILTTVEVPQLFQEKFNLDAEQLGLQFIAVIIGSVLGEQVGGHLSDIWMTRGARRRSRHSRRRGQHSPDSSDSAAEPEFRLWLSHIGFTLTIVGVIVFLIQTQNAAYGKWNITPVIGIAIAACGSQIVTTILITYSVDCLDKEEAAGVGVLITFVRQIWGFIGPFWFPGLFDGVGLAGSAGVAVALIVGISVLPTILLQWKGWMWRDESQKKDECESFG